MLILISNINLFLIDNDLIQKIWTFSTCLVHLGFAVKYILFYRFNSNEEKIRFLNYLLCKDEKELKLNYKFGKIVVKESAKMIRLEEFGILWITQNLLPFTNIIIVQFQTFRSIYLAYLNSLEENGISIFGFMISIITSLTLEVVYLFESISVSSSYLIFM